MRAETRALGEFLDRDRGLHPEWPEHFAAEKERLLTVAHDAVIEHVGSTAADYLRDDPEHADAYFELKVRLAKECADDRQAYNAAKTDFIQAAVRRAGE